MHDNNRKWLTDLRAAFPAFFDGARVLEIGSRIWGGPNDTIRPFFTGGTYIGVDKLDGPGVDVRADNLSDLDARIPGIPRIPGLRFAHFDTLAIFSVFEHDPGWPHTLRTALTWLRPGGLLVTCFGAEGNQHHAPEPWAPVPHREFLKHCANLDLVVIDAFFEEERYGKDCAGCYNVVAGKPNVALGFESKPGWSPP